MAATQAGDPFDHLPVGHHLGTARVDQRKIVSKAALPGPITMAARSMVTGTAVVH